MSDDNAADGESTADDLGAPVAQLSDHTVPVSPEFRARVGRSIERRILAADATQFGLFAPFATLMEFLRVLFEGLGFIDADSATHAPSTEDTTE